jgi:hypothetical protein
MGEAVSLEDHLQKAVDRALHGARAQLEADLRGFAQELARAAAEERARAVKEAAETGAAEVRRQAQVQLVHFRDAAQKHADDVRRNAEAQIAELKRALDEVKQNADHQLEGARRAAQTEIAAARHAAQAEIDAARHDAQDKAAAARREADARVEEATQGANRRIAELTEEIGRVRESAAADIERIRQNAAHEAENIRQSAAREAENIRQTAATEIEKIRESAAAEVHKIRETAVGDLEATIAARLAIAAGETERRIAEALERARTDHDQTVLAQTASLANGIRSLDEAQSLSEVLDILAECAGRSVERAAVLVVKENRLNGWRFWGFDSTVKSAKSIELALDEAGLPGAVVRTGVAVSRAAVEPGASDERQPALPPFAQDAGTRHALALPLTVGGAVVAVLYADSPRDDMPSASSRWPAVLDMLVRHASRTLEAMTVQRAVGLSPAQPLARGSHAPVPGPVEHASESAEDAARRYARLLLSEIRMYNEPVVDAGRRSRDLLLRLSGEIARARRLYEARVPSSVAARADYFDQELVKTLADGDRSLLGSVQ